MSLSNQAATSQGGQRGRLKLIGEGPGDEPLAAKEWLVDAASLILVA